MANTERDTSIFKKGSDLLKENIPEIAVATGVLLAIVGGLGSRPNILAVVAGIGIAAYGADRIEAKAVQSDSRTL